MQIFPSRVGTYPALVLEVFLGKKKERAKRLSRLRENWGRRQAKRALYDVQELARRRPIEAADRYSLDEQTWSDLDMDYVYGVVDHTQTAPGAQCLWRLLHSPHLAGPAQDQQLLERLSTEPALREELQLALSKMEREEGYELPALLWDELPILRMPRWALHSLSWLLPITLMLGFLLPIFWLVTGAVLLANNLITFSYEKVLTPNLTALTSLSKLLEVAGELSALKSEAVPQTKTLLTTNLRVTKAIRSKVAWLKFDDPMAIHYWFRTMLLRNVIVFVSVVTIIRRHEKELREIFEAVGGLDVALSTASLRAYLGDYCEPNFEGEANQIVTENIYHPCVSEAVANDLELRDSNLLIMGSNMSGKSTFLKTIGVNAILAQTLGTVAASKYAAPPLRVMTSIDILDNLEEGTSYYKAEVESTLRLVQAAPERGPYLFILDEVFRGTNPVERVAAATAVLQYLGERHCVLASTHDSEICHALSSSYELGHFREELTDDGFTFDHKLRPGPSQSRNAIAMLEHAGYPSEVVAAAQEQVTVGSVRRQTYM